MKTDILATGDDTSSPIPRRGIARLLASGAIVLGTALAGSATWAIAADNEVPTSSAPLACDDGLKAAMTGT